MNMPHVSKWCLVAALAALGANLGSHEAMSAPPGPPDATGTQVLARGPVHEAFAETVTFDPEPGIVVTKAPPAAIQELPPEQKPEGAHVAWIPGYWGWDDDRSDFLWVSGVWRALPPGRQWMPGYWGKSAQGFQWTSGYWGDAKVTDVQYLPEPPATVEAGPNIPAPSPDDTWLPGNWVWQNGRYAWRPGFWATAQPNWDWIPAHYVYAPRGYVFVDGYWDYSLGRRGVLFAPVYFNTGVYSRPGFSYSPSVAVDLNLFARNLFLRPQYQHYYFGDYYAANYQTAGFYPSYSYNSGRYGYDPIYAHERWQHRRDAQWDERAAADFQNRRDHEDARPARIWNGPIVIGGGGVAAAVRNIVGASLDLASESANGGWQYERVDQAERQRLADQAQEVNRFRDQRQQWETQSATVPAPDPAHRGEPDRMRLPPSPIMARSADQLGQDHTPPQAHSAPPLDTVVQPKPRTVRSPGQPEPRTVNRVPLETPQPQTVQPAPQPHPPTAQPHPADRPAPRPAAGSPAAKPSQDKHEEKGKGQ